MKNRGSLLVYGCGLLLLFGCSKPVAQTESLTGYLVSETVAIASPEGGYLEQLSVARGQSVETGQVLFRIDSAVLELNLSGARAWAEASSSRARDAKLGVRPEELTVLEAELEEAEAQRTLKAKELERVRTLFSEGVSTPAQLDIAQSLYTQSREAVRLQRARLQLSTQGQREYQQKAFAAESESAESKEAVAAWQLAQALRTAPAAAFVQDILYQPGEWVSAGSPVVLLRLSEVMRARFFLSPEQLIGLRLGDAVGVAAGGDTPPIAAIVERVADSPEYTPPIIFSREQAARLVFLVEARLPVEWARRLHPGQPVTVHLKPLAVSSAASKP